MPLEKNEDRCLFVPGDILENGSEETLAEYIHDNNMEEVIVKSGYGSVDDELSIEEYEKVLGKSQSLRKGFLL